jgi:2-polyprenyl-3-methyl-5-hydroxy-6-metoxy-1,4-benzoquinol methylase
LHNNKGFYCNLCTYSTEQAADEDLGKIQGNTEKYLQQTFTLWRCPKCKTIHSLEPVDFTEIYADYPLNQLRTLDIYARRTLANLLKRLSKVGVKHSDSILDYGCGNGVFIDFLKQKGFNEVSGYDPFVAQFNQTLEQQANKQYDVVVLNDVLEHVEEPDKLLADAARYVKEGGILYAGTADSEGVTSMKQLKKHTMRLHQPFHRKIITAKKLEELGEHYHFKKLISYQRSYMDTLFPFGNYRFLDEFNAALGHNLDKALDPKSASIVMKKPSLLFYAFAGYFIPSADEPAIIWRIQHSRDTDNE